MGGGAFLSLYRFRGLIVVVTQAGGSCTFSHYDVTLCNSPGHCAMYLGIAQHSKSKFFRDLITKIYSVLDGPLTPKEGLPTKVRMLIGRIGILFCIFNS